MIKVDYFAGYEPRNQIEREYYKYVYHEWYDHLKDKVDAKFIYYLRYNKYNLKRIIRNKYMDYLTPYHVLKNRRKESILHVLSLEFCEILARKKRDPTVLTVYDIIALLPNASQLIPYPWNCKKKISAIKSIKNADRILTISEYSKEDILKYIKVKENKIDVIYLAVNHDIFYPRENNEIIKTKYGLLPDSIYIINVGTDGPRKNIETIIKVIKILKDKKMDVQFIKIGRYNDSSYQHQKIVSMINEYGLQNNVVFHKYVPAEDLPNLYSISDLMIYPNLYDGFGLTLLESMACGCPVICSNTTCIPEIVGNAAITVNPLDIKKIADYAYELLNSNTISEHFREEGIKRASEFTWEKTAEGMVKSYKELL